MYDHLLVPVDGNELSERTMTASLELARRLQAKVTGFVAELDAGLPAVGRHPSVVLRELEEAQAKADQHAKLVLQRFAELAQEAGVVFSGHHVQASTVDDAIVQAAQDLGCDMIVMTTHGRGAFGELLFGSHTKNVLARSKLPLLVLR